MPKHRKPVTGLALSFIREALELEQTEVAGVLGVTPGTVSDYERGQSTKTREEVERLVAKVGVSPQAVDVVFEATTAVRRDGGLDPPLLPIPISQVARAALGRTQAEAAREVKEALLDQMLIAQVTSDRRRAQRTWKTVERQHPATSSDTEGLRRAVEGAPGFATWAFADLLAERSLATAPERPKVALVLGELALRAAEGAAADPTFLDHLKAKSWATIGNARRVLGDLHDAERAFLDARRFWPVGAPSQGGLLSEARLFDLEASLRRDQRLFDDAHALLDQAFALTPEGPARGRLLVQRSAVFEQQGNFEGSISALRLAVPTLGEEFIGRPRLGVLFNLALNLDHLGRSAETLALIPEVRALAAAFRRDTDLLRVHWLETRARIALGERQGADLSLDQIRRDFKARGLLHDAALAGLELAILYLEDDRTAETQKLSVELTAVFRGMGIEREQLAAVWLFLESAEKGVATAEIARQAAAALLAACRER